ncbi:hypothetical protein WJX77_012668 [Trebouxia sp. C0004]
MAVQEVLGFSCINDTRNGLLLAKPVEEAFDAGFLCFILGEDGRISPSAVPEIDASAWSHNSYLERVKDYLADPEFQYQVGPIDRLDSISEMGKLDDSG